MKLQKHQIINIQAYKHNGKLYRQWNGAKVIENSKDLVVVLMNKTKVIEKEGQKWVLREPKVWFFPLAKFFNTMVLIRKKGIFYYTNVASSPIFEDNTIKFIDYDIDIKVYPQQKTRIVDQKEYEMNQKQFHYSQKLIRKIAKAIDEVLEIIRNKNDHFNHKIFNNHLSKLVKTKDLSPIFLKTNFKN